MTTIGVEKYWTYTVYIIVVAVVFIIVYLTFVKYNKKAKKPTQKKDDNPSDPPFNMANEFQLLAHRQIAYLKSLKR